MKIETLQFGEIDIDEKDIISFNEGLLAFEEYKKFIIIDNFDEELPFKTLQSLNEPELSFIIMNPFVFRKDYDFTLSESNIEKLKLESEDDVLVYSLVVIPQEITKMTANLSGPIIINNKTKLAKQIILDNKKYKTKHYIIEEMNNMSKEEK